VEDEIENNESEKLVITEGQVSHVAEIEGSRRSNRRRPFSKRWEHFRAQKNCGTIHLPPKIVSFLHLFLFC